jgi:putative endonuclease
MHNTKGERGEDLAEAYLMRQGYKIVERNWHMRYAEIDIVALEAETLVIVEVKTRYDHQYGSAASAMTPFKIATLARSAYLYSSKHPELPDFLRIDFVGVEYVDSRTPQITHIKNITG